LIPDRPHCSSCPHWEKKYYIPKDPTGFNKTPGFWKGWCTELNAKTPDCHSCNMHPEWMTEQERKQQDCEHAFTKALSGPVFTLDTEDVGSSIPCHQAVDEATWESITTHVCEKCSYMFYESGVVDG